MLSKAFVSNCEKRLAYGISKRFNSDYHSPSYENNIMDRLSKGPVIGDGGFVFALEKRGYVKAGPWTPEVNMEDPNAVQNLHREFARAGSDVMQTFTFYASEDKLENRGNYAQKSFGISDINKAACNNARIVANEFNCLVAGGLSQTPTYLSSIHSNSSNINDKLQVKTAVQQEFSKQLKCFNKEKVDFMIVEYFEHVEETCWAIEAVKDIMPDHSIVASMCINNEGDLHGISTYDCALQMAENGANVVGINCHFDPNMTLKALNEMRKALENNGLMWNKNNNPNGIHLIAQPIAYHTPDVSKQGFIDLPEFPFGLEPRLLTRWDMHQFAREAWDMGVRYIGGCCGFEPYHIRAVCEELESEFEKGSKPEYLCDASRKHERWGKGLEMHTKPWVRERAKKDYWKNLKPASGRPYCPACSKPDNWGVTQGHEQLKQDKLRS